MDWPRAALAATASPGPVVARASAGPSTYAATSPSKGAPSWGTPRTVARVAMPRSAAPVAVVAAAWAATAVTPLLVPVVPAVAVWVGTAAMPEPSHLVGVVVAA